MGTAKFEERKKTEEFVGLAHTLREKVLVVCFPAVE